MDLLPVYPYIIARYDGGIMEGKWKTCERLWRNYVNASLSVINNSKYGYLELSCVKKQAVAIPNLPNY
jgi:hypothetical protein